MKKALITGITGQEGAYLAEFLLKKGYEVHGIKRRVSSFNTARIDHLYQYPHEQNKRFILHYGNLTDSSNLVEIDPRYFRPAQVDLLIVDPSKALTKFGWKHRIGLDERIKMMVTSDL